MERVTEEEMALPMEGAKLDLCREAVKTLPERACAYYAERFRRGFMEQHRPSPDDAALEIYRYAFLGEKPPRRFRELVRPILVALRFAADGDD